MSKKGPFLKRLLDSYALQLKVTDTETNYNGNCYKRLTSSKSQIMPSRV